MVMLLEDWSKISAPLFDFLLIKTRPFNVTAFTREGLEQEPWICEDQRLFEINVISDKAVKCQRNYKCIADNVDSESPLSFLRYC